jgi:hypothetical protein
MTQWCVIANVRERIHHGPNNGDWIQIGTKHFSPGTKVYVIGVHWDAELTKICAIGRHRGTARLVAIGMRPGWLTDWRVKLIYEPRVLKKISEGGWPPGSDLFPSDDTETSRQKAVHLASLFAEKFPPLQGPD